MSEPGLHARERGTGRRLPWPAVFVLAAVAWYLLVAGTWLLADLVAPTDGGTIGSPLALPLLPAELLRLVDSVLFASVLVAVLFRRPSAVAPGTVLAAAAAAYVTVLALRGAAENFWSDPRLLVPELVVFGLATVAGLVLGAWAGGRPDRLAVAVAVVAPSLMGVLLGAAGDVVRMAGGTTYDVPPVLLAFDVVALAAVAGAGAVLVRHRRWVWFALVAVYLVVAAFARSAASYALVGVHVGMPQRYDDLIGSAVDVLPLVAGDGSTWRALVALAVGAVVGVFQLRRDASSARHGASSGPVR